MQALVSYCDDGTTELVYQFSVDAENMELARAAIQKYFDGIGGRPDGISEFYEAPRGGIPENPCLIRLDRDGVVLSVGFDFLD